MTAASTWDRWLAEDPWWASQSANWRKVTDLIDAWTDGALDSATFQAAVLALGLRQHPLGCGYLMMPVPAPPPGVRIDGRIMPPDWEGTWGEVAMAYLTGLLSNGDYQRLHAKAHPDDSACRPTTHSLEV